MFSKVTLASSLLAAVASGQQIGTQVAEVHPALPVQTCAAGGTCTTLDTSIVLDANWRWVHSLTGTTNCYTGNTWDTALCPDDTTCAENCALDGADYSATYGITTSGNTLKLDFVTQSAQENVGSRTYLMASDTEYQMFNLLGQEFTFDVDVSNLPCGLNGALYFVSMSADGGVSKYPTNKAGAQYGTGYCDSQCPQDLKFIDGVANAVGWSPDTNNANSGVGLTGTCCDEMDIWEANSISTAFTPHVCSSTGQTACTGNACGDSSTNRYDSICDKDGCDFNTYRFGNTTFYGPGMTVDTTKLFTVVTQFITNDGTTTGTLSAIKRFYVQDGVVIDNANTDMAGVTTTNEITDAFCEQQKAATNNTDEFETLGGLAKMGKDFEEGMVLVMSLWDDYAVNMLWLDSTYPTTSPAGTPGAARGTCPTNSGVPATVEANSPNAYVTYGNIKYGPIGSTFNSGGTGTSGSSSVSSAVTHTSTATSKTTATSTKTSTAAATTTAAKGTVGEYGQCGGTGWTGATACVSPYVCTVLNSYYSQCLAA
jgi:cellulose 1,4-beta-cellobiosidase